MSPQTNKPIHNITLDFEDQSAARDLFGTHNINMDFLAKKTDINISCKGTSLTLSGSKESCVLVANMLKQLYEFCKLKKPLHPRDLPHAFNVLKQNPNANLQNIFLEPVFASAKRKTITAKTLSQQAYVESLKSSDMTFGIGPAGTGKTYLAVAVALSFLVSGKIKKIILTRPAVEAGERLGFLPGDLTQKVDPYLRPLYDAFYDMMDSSRVNEMLEANIIEIAPLAFMRGRTLNDAFIILDEAQNTTPEQMKMFLTRLGFNSKVAITGDITQIDLPKEKGKVASGLVQALQVLNDVEDINIINLKKEDVVRHPLVGKIIEAYEKYTNKYPI